MSGRDAVEVISAADIDDRTVAEEFDALARAGSVTRRVLIGRLGGFAGIAVGLLLVVLAAVSNESLPDRGCTAAAALLALSAGSVLISVPWRVPIWTMDAMGVMAAGLLVIVGDLSTTMRPALPGIYVTIGTILFALRSWRVAALQTSLLGASYAGVLVVGPAEPGRVLRWAAVMVAVVTSGLFIRWLVSTVAGLAKGEHDAWAEAEAASVELAATGRAKSAFLARMSHELRTPLNVVLGFTDLLGEELVGSLNARQLDYVQDVSESARHLVSLVDDVLDPEKVEQGAVELVIEPIDVSGALADATRMVRERATAGGVSLDLDCPFGIGVVHADRRKLRQVVVNLLSNAVKFTPPGGRVVLAARRARGRLVVRVQDTGIGIAAEDLERIFEEFEQGEPSLEGTGLGLPLARRLIEMHGGLLWADSEPGAGSVFTFELPLRRPAAELAGGGDPTGDGSDLHAAFTQPGSTANRELVARVGSWLCFDAMAALLVFSALAPAWRVRETLLALAGVSLVTGMFTRRWSSRLPMRGVEAFGLFGIAGITVLTAYAGRFSDLVPLAYGWVTMTTFALWPRRRAMVHFALIIAAYTLVLVLRPGGHPVGSGLSILDALLVNAAVSSWVVSRLCRLVVTERAARLHAEEIRQRLDAASRHKSAFLANMSHELRTPLNAVLGFTDLLASRAPGPLNETQAQYLEDIQSAARHLLSLINDILDLAKLDAGQLRLTREVVVVAEVLGQAANSACTLAGGRRIDVRVSVDDAAQFVVADQHRFEQVVANLVSNAVKFTPEGGRVDVNARAVDDQLVVSVRDTGIGIPPQQRRTIFEAFMQGPQLMSDQVPQGTGLGLSLAKSLVELHGGVISVESQPDRGSTFVVSIPGVTATVPRLEAAP
jgi:signal transduction histidine kinase